MIVQNAVAVSNSTTATYRSQCRACWMNRAPANRFTWWGGVEGVKGAFVELRGARWEKYEAGE